MHDDTQPSRIFEMAKSLKDGQFPVRLVADLGYGFGYPLFNFYAPLPYYIGAIFHIGGAGVITSTKIMFSVAMIASGITMYLLVCEIAGVLPALLSSVFYIYAPYHAVDLYVRGDIGELYALVFIPLIILGFIKIIKSKPITNVTVNRNLLNGMAISIIGLGGVLLSHNISGFITLFFLGIGICILLFFVLMGKLDKRIFITLIITIILGGGLSASFTIPALLEKDFTRVSGLTSGGSDFHNHFVFIDQLWNSPWGFGGSGIGRDDGMSFKIGKIHVILGLISIPWIALLFLYKRIDRLKLILYMIFLSILVLSVFLMLEQSRFIWELFPGFPYIQYPWRFLCFVILSLSVIPSFIFVRMDKKFISALIFILIISSFVFNAKYFIPQYYSDIADSSYISPLNLKYKISKISDEFLPKNFIIPANEKAVASNNLSDSTGVRIENRFESTTVKRYIITADNSVDIILNIANFPGWKASIDGKKTSISDWKGRMKIFMTGGKHKLVLEFSNTPIRLIANTISILSLFLLVYISLFSKGIPKWLKKILLKS